MLSRSLLLVGAVFFLVNCSVDKPNEFVLGDTVLVYDEVSTGPEADDVLMVDFYARGYEMQFLDPTTGQPYSGTIVDDENFYQGRYSLIDGYMKELITYYEDGSPSYFAVYNEGEIIKMNSWYRDGSIRSQLKGGEQWEYYYFDSEGNQTMHIEDNLQTEYFADGTVKSRIPFDKSNLYHGTATAYNPDGTKKAELEYYSGKLISVEEANSQP
jgi:hypothetical protein